MAALDELQFDTGEQRHLHEKLLNSSQGSTVPYIVGLAEYLAKAIPIISSSLELLFDRYSINTSNTKSADISYQYGKGIIQLVVLFLPIRKHLLTV